MVKQSLLYQNIWRYYNIKIHSNGHKNNNVKKLKLDVNKKSYVDIYQEIYMFIASLLDLPRPHPPGIKQ